MNTKSISPNVQLAQSALVRAAATGHLRSELTVRMSQHAILNVVDQELLEAARAQLREETLTAIAKLSVNEFWFMMLLSGVLLSVAKDGSETQLESVQAQVLAINAEVERQVPGLIDEVNTGHFTRMDAENLQRARLLGIIVTDPTWPYGDQDLINPIFWR